MKNGWEGKYLYLLECTSLPLTLTKTEQVQPAQHYYLGVQPFSLWGHFKRSESFTKNATRRQFGFESTFCCPCFVVPLPACPMLSVPGRWKSGAELTRRHLSSPPSKSAKCSPRPELSPTVHYRLVGIIGARPSVLRNKWIRRGKNGNISVALSPLDLHCRVFNPL